MTNHYHILGISESASDQEIRLAYRQMAVKYHPDKHAGDPQMEEMFKQVNRAYQVLSDPYQKAQFDLQLHYQRFNQHQQTTTYTPPATKTKHYGRRPYYKGRKVNYRENNKATLYAFLITFAIALVVMFAKSMYDFYLQKKYEALLASRREVYREAVADYKKDSIRQSLLKLSDLAPFKKEEKDMQTFKNELLQEVIFKGEANYNQQNFDKAVRYYELVEQFSPYRPLTMRARLAQSYRFTGQPIRSIHKFKELIEADYKVVATLREMSEVYRYELDNTEEALRYLELARSVVIDQYESRFGKAYMVVVNAQIVPAHHYYLYRDLAEMYNETNQPANARGVTNWMKHVWPDSAAIYALSGQTKMLQKLRNAACRDYRTAVSLGFEGSLPEYCQ